MELEQDTSLSIHVSGYATRSISVALCLPDVFHRKTVSEGMEIFCKKLS